MLVTENPLFSAERVLDWYGDHEAWGLSNPLDEKNRVQLLAAELPDLHYKNTLVIQWRTIDEVKQLFPGDEVEYISLLGNIHRSRAPYPVHKLFTFLENAVKQAKHYDLIIIDRIMYHAVLGHSLTLVRHYIQQLLEENGLLISCSASKLAPSRFPLLLIEESLIDLLDTHYLVRMYVK